MPLRVLSFRTALCCLAAAAAVTACRRSSPAVTETPGTHVFVSDETGGNVVVLDPDRGEVVERIAVGKRPRGIRLSADGRTLYVALSGSPIAGPGVDESK